jgi:hypothetical protein
VGGDYFDAFLMRDGSLALVIGDASGHAIGPALVIAETRAYIRAFAMTSADPGTILTLANQRLCEDLPGSHFVTLFLGRLDPRTGSLSYAGAGHCPGYVLSPAGQIRATLLSQGLPLSIDSAGRYPSGSVNQLAAGELLFLYTDGLVEAGSSGSVGLFGIERTLDVLRAHWTETPDQILDAICRAASDFSPGCEQSDDMTAILVKVDADTRRASRPRQRKANPRATHENGPSTVRPGSKDGDEHPIPESVCRGKNGIPGANLSLLHKRVVTGVRTGPVGVCRDPRRHGCSLPERQER